MMLRYVVFVVASTLVHVFQGPDWNIR
jgi:hypothetical protein